MKTSILAISLLVSITLSAQEKFLFDTSRIDSTTKLIGRYPQYDKKKKYRHFNFIIDNPELIKQTIMSLSLRKEQENVIGSTDFRITIVQNSKEIKTWIVSPAINSIMFDSHSYEFDFKKIKDLAKRFPFDYRFEKKSFKTRADYEEYVGIEKNFASFLFDYEPQFRYEGSFEIEFPRNKNFSNPKTISEFLTPFIESIVKKDEYTITYALSEKNLDDLNQFTMTITGSKRIFDELKIQGLINQNWTPTVEEAWFFYRTK